MNARSVTPLPHAEFEALGKQELHALTDAVRDCNAFDVQRCVDFILAETRGLWHGRARALMCRRLKHCELGRTHRDLVVSCILKRLQTGNFSEQFKDQLRLALHLDPARVVEICNKSLGSDKEYVRRYAQWTLELHARHSRGAASMSPRPAILYRPAVVDDLAGLWEVRYSVAQNTLTPGRISDEDLRRSIDEDGRGWVAEQSGRIVGFSIGLKTGNVWALFVRPDAEGQGIGSRLHAELLAWFAGQPIERIWLSTGADTRARLFYEARGWKIAGPYGKDEVRLERLNE